MTILLEIVMWIAIIIISIYNNATKSICILTFIFQNAHGTQTLDYELQFHKIFKNDLWKSFIHIYIYIYWVMGYKFIIIIIKLHVK